MKLIKAFVFLCLLLTIAFTTLHKYYVSITKIEYIKEAQSVQIITRIFTDDLEHLLKERYDSTIVLASKKNEAKINDYIEKYVLSKVKITINGTESDIKFIGKEYDEDVVQCFLEIENVAAIKAFEIENKILFDIFSEQKNIVRTAINKKEKSFILIPEKTKGMLNF